MKQVLVLTAAVVLFPICLVIVGIHICAGLANSGRLRQKVSLSSERERASHRMAIKQALLNASPERRADIPV